MTTLPRTHNDYRFDERREDNAEQTPHDETHPITYFILPEDNLFSWASRNIRPQDNVVLTAGDEMLKRRYQRPQP